MANQRAEDAFKANFWTTRDLWTLFGNVTSAEGIDRTKDLINFMRWRTGDPDAKLPTPATRAGDGRDPHGNVDRYIESRLAELARLRAAAHAALDRGVDIDDILDHVEDAGRHISAAATRVAKAGHPVEPSV